MVLFLTLEVALLLCVFPCFGLFGPFLKQIIIENHVGTSVVLFLTFENVGVIWYNITCFSLFVFFVFFLLMIFYLMLALM